MQPKQFQYSTIVSNQNFIHTNLKKMKKVIIISVSIFALSAIFVACQKEIASKPNASKLTPVTPGAQSVAATAEEANQIALVLNTNPLADFSKSSGGCIPVVTYDPGPDVYPRTVTIDYGESCTSASGVTRSGKIILKYSNDLAITGSQELTTYNNYYVDGIKIEGGTKFANNGEVGTQGQIIYRLTYKNRKSIQPDGGYTNINGHHRVIKRGEGSGYPGFPDGDFRATGLLNYTQFNSVSGVTTQFTVATRPQDALIYKSGCDWITKGKSLYTYSDQTTANLDYGNGECDNLGTFTKNGVTTTIVLAP